MATGDNNERPGQRRIVVRRTRNGARFTPRGRIDGTPREIDEVDDAIEPELLERHVREQARATPEDRDDTGGPNPRQRMLEVEQAGNATYAKEFRLGLLQRLLLRKLPLDQIAQQLGVSISTIEKDRALIKKRMREAAKELNIDEMIGGQTFMYDEIAAMAMRIASTTSGERSVPVAMQLAAMRTTLASQADKTRFLQSAGVFDVLRFRKADSGEAMSDIQILMERTAQMLSGLADDGMGGFQAFDLNEIEPESEEL
jgi:DNA-directed RNA polymerase specialized sigma24 family protein